MSRSLFLIALMMFCVDAFAETHIITVDKHIRERHNWTLGYQPDQVISRYRTDVDPPLKSDIFFPKDHSVNDRRSCVIFFFGGGWMGGATAQFYGFSRYLASRGMVAISAEYRTHNRHKAIPKDCVEDGRQAIRYVREHSAESGIDPNKIVLSGGSAGGHIAAAVTMCEQIDTKPKSLISSVPNALVLFNPVYNNGPNGGYGHSRVKAYWQAISPHHNIQPSLLRRRTIVSSANCD